MCHHLAKTALYSEVRKIIFTYHSIQLRVKIMTNFYNIKNKKIRNITENHSIPLIESSCRAPFTHMYRIRCRIVFLFLKSYFKLQSFYYDNSCLYFPEQWFLVELRYRVILPITCIFGQKSTRNLYTTARTKPT